MFIHVITGQFGVDGIIQVVIHYFSTSFAKKFMHKNTKVPTHGVEPSQSSLHRIVTMKYHRMVLKIGSYSAWYIIKVKQHFAFVAVRLADTFSMPDVPHRY